MAKQCVQCQNELPETAAHCVFCGAKQPAAAPAAAAPAKTMFGYSAAEAARQSAPVPNPAMAPPKGPPPGVAYASTQPVAPEQATQPISVERREQMAKTVAAHIGAGGPMAPGGPMGKPQPAVALPPTVPSMDGPAEAQRLYNQQFFGGQPAAAPAAPMQAPMQPAGGQYGAPPQGYGPPPGAMPPPMQPMGGPQYGAPPQGYGAPPQGYGPPPGAPMQLQPMGGPQQGYGAPPQGYDAPPQGYGAPPQGYGAPPQGYGAPPQGYGPPPGAMPPSAHGYGAPTSSTDGTLPPVSGGMPMSHISGMANAPMAYNPMSDMTEQVRRAPPYSPAGGTHAGAFEPWAESLKTLMLVFGVLLIACFVAPWGVGAGKTMFSWSLFSLEGVPAKAKIIPILFVATGALAILFGTLSVPSLVRGLAAILIALAPMFYLLVVAQEKISWQDTVELVGGLALLPGLILRSKYGGSMLARLLVTVGVALVLAPKLIPDHGVVPLVAAMKALSGSKIDLGILAQLVHAALALACLLVWLPGPGGGPAVVFAWAFIAWPLIDTLAPILGKDGAMDAVKGQLWVYIYLPLAAMAWLALVAYGGATVAGKQLETA